MGLVPMPATEIMIHCILKHYTSTATIKQKVANILRSPYCEHAVIYAHILITYFP